MLTRFAESGVVQHRRAEMSAAVGRNKRWMKTKIKDGYQIRDVGSEPGRPVPSVYYAMEQQVLREADALVTPLPGF